MKASLSPSPPRRAIIEITAAPRMLEGEGFVVRRPVPARGLEAVGPFIMLDHMGPVVMGPGEAKGAPTHPHAGMETLTYLLEGRGHHHDSLGNFSIMGSGDVQWMRAGSGIIHDEGPDEVSRRDGGPVHALQLWIDLPRPHRHDPPAYRQFSASEIPVATLGEGVTIKLIAGHFGDLTGPVDTYAKPFLMHVTLADSGITKLDPAVPEIAAYILRGSGQVQGATVKEGDFIRFAGLGAIEVTASSAGLEIVLAGGEPLSEPIVRYGPFVMNTHAEIQTTIERYHGGQFGTIDRNRKTTH